MKLHIKYSLIFLFAGLLFIPLQTYAGVEPCGVKGAIPMQVYIPFITANKPDADGKDCYFLKPFSGNATDTGAGGGIEGTPDAGELVDYIKGLYTFALSIGGMIAMIMIMVGGFKWITAGGNAQGVGKAKEMISSAAIGLILLLLSYTILATINPQLVNLSGIDVGKDIDPSSATETQPRTKEELKALCRWATELPDANYVGGNVTKCGDKPSNYDSRIHSCYCPYK